MTDLSRRGSTALVRSSGAKSDFGSGLVKAGGYAGGMWVISLLPFINLPMLVVLVVLAGYMMKR